MRQKNEENLPEHPPVFVKATSRKKKKRRGVFYTPDELSVILSRWAIQQSGNLVLEPGFGGCGFLEAAKERLKSLGSPQPEKHIFGCDVDKMAFKKLREAFGEVAQKNFLKADFLALTDNDFRGLKFDAILSNPPYVSNHNMFGVQRQTAFALKETWGDAVGQRASLWAYFVWHGLHFLRPGARVAWVLPGSLINADYGRVLLSKLASKFRRVSVLSLQERLFLNDGTDESTEVLLADGYGVEPDHANVTVEWPETVQDCAQLLADWDSPLVWRKVLNARSKRVLITPECEEILDRIGEDPRHHKLGEFARISIGIVTGANRFFVLDRPDLTKNDLTEEHCRYVLPKFGIAKGLVLCSADMKEAGEQGNRCYLVYTAGGGDRIEAIQRYLDTFPIGLKNSNRTFKKRLSWHQPDDGKVPDAFFPYMNHIGPRLVLNEAKVTSTNTVHRVYFDLLSSQGKRELLGISLMSTYSQLSAEIEGRTYGSGVLKFEPSEARNIRVLVPSDANNDSVQDVHRHMDAALRAGSATRAKMLADEFLGRELPTLYTEERRKVLSDALSALRLRRHSNGKPGASKK